MLSSIFDRPRALMFPSAWAHPKAHWFSLAVAAVGLVAVGAWVDLSPRVESDFFFSEDDPQLQVSLELDRRYPGRNQVVVRAEDRTGDPQAYVDRIGDLTEAFSAVEGVTSVRSITTDEAAPSPLFSRILLTPDESATNLILLVDATDPAILVPRLERVVERLNTADVDVVMAGVPVIVERIRRSLFRDLIVFSALSLLLYGLLAAWVYKNVGIVAGALTTCVSACSATLLVTQALGIEIGLLTANLITIVFVLTLSHIVFLTANWRRAGTLTLAPDQRVARAVSWTLEASFWSMATTLMGFLSLLVASARPLRELGIAGAIGAATAMGVAYAIFPTFLGRGAEGPTRAAGPAGATPWVQVRPLGLLAVIAIIVIALGFGVPKLDTDPGLLTYFAESSELRRGLEQVDRDGGSSTLNIAIRDRAGGRIDENEVYERLWRFQEVLEADSAVGAVLSPAVLLGHARTLPLASFLSLGMLLDIAESPQLDEVALSFVTRERDEGLFFIRMKESVREPSRQAVMDRLAGYAREADLEPVQVGGLYDLQAQLGRLIASSLRIGLGGLLLLFAGIAAVVSRSARVSVIMVACLAGVPLVVLGTFGHLGVAVDIITSPAANVALAMGVDSMIHLVVRVRHLRSGGLAFWQSWAQARAQIVGPVLTASLLICVGFGIFVLSNFPPTRRFGFAVILGTLTAAAMALVTLPLAVQALGQRHVGAQIAKQ
jgi:predicted RND superfamily exporter protein